MSDDKVTVAPTASVTRTYSGHTITIGGDWTFVVTGPEFDSGNLRAPFLHTFSSLRDATEEIDKRVNTRVLVETRNYTAVVLSQEGVVTTIRGINRRDGSVLGIAGRHMYPNVTWIKQTIIAARELHAQYTALMERIKPYAISAQYRGHSQMEPTLMQRKLDELDKEVREKTDAAEQIQSVPPSSTERTNAAS